MQRAVRGKRLTIERVGIDRYGRTLARVFAEGADLSCTMIEQRQARYIARWDNGGALARNCRAARR